MESIAWSTLTENLVHESLLAYFFHILCFFILFIHIFHIVYSYFIIIFILFEINRAIYSTVAVNLPLFLVGKFIILSNEILAVWQRGSELLISLITLLG